MWRCISHLSLCTRFHSKHISSACHHLVCWYLFAFSQPAAILSTGTYLHFLSLPPSCLLLLICILSASQHLVYRYLFAFSQPATILSISTCLIFLHSVVYKKLLSELSAELWAMASTKEWGDWLWSKICSYQWCQFVIDNTHEWPHTKSLKS